MALLADDTRPLLGDESEEEPQVVRKTTPFPPCRVVLCVMAFLGHFNLYALRVNLSVALVAMVNSSYDEVKNSSNECPGDLVANGTSSQESGEFNWDSNLQGLVLGAFFYGYITTQLPGGYLAERIGGKWLYGGGVLCTSLLTLLTPVAARISVYFLIAVRILEGIGEGMTFPATHAMMAQWAPPLERSKMGTFIYSGAQFGTVASLPISGLLCAYGPFGGWPSVFYLFGTLGCLWFIAWALLIHSRPADHPRISDTEKTYIEKSIGHKEKKPAVPVKAIATSVPFWACLVAHVSFNWGFYTILTCMPTYMKEVLKIDISQSGILSALPYLAQGIIMITIGQIVDYLRYNHYISTTVGRKVANSIGTLMGLTNTAATIPGFVGPQVVGILTNNNPTHERWQIVFWISAAICMVGMVTFALFGSGKEQTWATSEFLEAQQAQREIKRQKAGSREQGPDGVLQFSRPMINDN